MQQSSSWLLLFCRIITGGAKNKKQKVVDAIKFRQSTKKHKIYNRSQSFYFFHSSLPAFFSSIFSCSTIFFLILLSINRSLIPRLSGKKTKVLIHCLFTFISFQKHTHPLLFNPTASPTPAKPTLNLSSTNLSLYVTPPTTTAAIFLFFK